METSPDRHNLSGVSTKIGKGRKPSFIVGRPAAGLVIAIDAGQGLWKGQKGVEAGNAFSHYGHA